MASLYTRDGKWFVDVYLKKYRGRIACGTNKQTAAQVHRHIENVIESRRYGTDLKPETAKYLERDSRISERLLNMAILDPETHGRRITLAELCLSLIHI